jgi:hypothetical protein
MTAPDGDTATTTLPSLIDKMIDREPTTSERAAALAGYHGWYSGIKFQANIVALRARIVAVIGRRPLGSSSRRSNAEISYLQLKTGVAGTAPDEPPTKEPS